MARKNKKNQDPKAKAKQQKSEKAAAKRAIAKAARGKKKKAKNANRGDCTKCKANFPNSMLRKNDGAELSVVCRNCLKKVERPELYKELIQKKSPPAPVTLTKKKVGSKQQTKKPKIETHSCANKDCGKSFSVKELYLPSLADLAKNHFGGTYVTVDDEAKLKKLGFCEDCKPDDMFRTVYKVIGFLRFKSHELKREKAETEKAQQLAEAKAEAKRKAQLEEQRKHAAEQRRIDAEAIKRMNEEAVMLLLKDFTSKEQQAILTIAKNPSVPTSVEAAVKKLQDIYTVIYSFEELKFLDVELTNRLVAATKRMVINGLTNGANPRDTHLIHPMMVKKLGILRDAMASELKGAA